MKTTERSAGLLISGITSVEGPIIRVEDTGIVAYDEFVEIIDPNNQTRVGRVLEVGDNVAVIEVFSGTTGLTTEGTRVRFSGRSLQVPVSREMLGRIFNGMGKPIDHGPLPLAHHFADINGRPINPTARLYPRDYIQTGISTIDAMNTLVMGQRCQSFWQRHSHDLLASQIVRQARGSQAGVMTNVMKTLRLSAGMGINMM